jgi:hypothetical protein
MSPTATQDVLRRVAGCLAVPAPAAGPLTAARGGPIVLGKGLSGGQAAGNDWGCRQRPELPPARPSQGQCPAFM